MYDLEVVYLSPQELTPYENNTRRHNPEDIDGIVKSIEDTGFNDPIGIWGDKNLIVEGHGRQLAAIQMGLDKVPCIRLDHLTDTQRRIFETLPLDHAVPIDYLTREGFSVGEIMAAMTVLEIKGLTVTLPGGLYSRK